MKKKSSKKKILIIIIILIIVGILGVLTLKKLFPKDKEQEVKVIKEIKGYGYKLNENETNIYKDEFYKLEEILTNNEINYEEYAMQVAKLFIIDFYTLDNKLSKNDIGGTEFIKESMRDNFIEEARSTFYKYLEVKSDKRTQKLPIVSEILDTSIENATFKYNDKTVDENAYRVTISWNYKEDLGYETEAKMILVNENNKLYIIEMN